MPQLDLATFPPQLIWLAITFIALYLVMRAVGLPRVGEVIAARRARIDGDLEKAQQLKNETEAVITAYEKALAEARAQAQITLRETTEQLNALSAERQRKVVEELTQGNDGGGAAHPRCEATGARLAARHRHRGDARGGAEADRRRARWRPRGERRRWRDAGARLMPEFLMDAEFWVLIAFVVAISFLVYKAKDTITGALDARAVKIKAELDEAQKLREEAQAKLAEFQLKQRDALKDAEGIIALAKEEAQRLAAQGAKDLEAAIERRRRMAQEKIALEEQKAMSDLRNVAVDVAVAALRRVLAEDLNAAQQSALIDNAINALPPTLH